MKEEILNTFNKEEINPNTNVFMIDGKRGSGKTTFMRCLIKELINTSSKEINHKFIDLLTLDPTLISSGEYIVFSIIAKIKQLVENSKINYCSEKTDKYELWRKKYKNLANGLSETQKDLRLDILLELDYNVKKSDDILLLNKNFDEFFKISTQILGCDSFIISFDDMDTKFSLGWELLETIRSHLLNKHILILISGNLDLFLNIANENLKNQSSDSGNQYLIKLIQSKHIFHLSSLLEKKDDINLIIQNNHQKQTSIEEKLFDVLSKNLNIKDKHTLQAITILLLDTRLRSIFQILLFNDISPSKFNLLLRDVFSHANLDGVRKFYFKDIIIHMIDTYAGKGNDFPLNFFMPKFINQEDDLKNLITLSTVSAHCHRDPIVCLHYIFQGIGSVFIYNKFVDSLPKTDNSLELKKNFKSHFNDILTGSIDLWASDISTLYTKGSEIYFFLIKTEIESSTFNSEVMKVIFFLSTVKILDNIPKPSTKISTKITDRGNFYISIFKLFGIIQTILRFGAKGIFNYSNLERNIMLKYKKNYGTMFSEPLITDTSNPELMSFNNLTNIWKNKCQSLKNSCKYSFVDLEHIWRIFYFSILSFSSKKINSQEEYKTLMIEIYKFSMLSFRENNAHNNDQALLKIITTCPIWLPFIREHNELYYNFKDFYGDEILSNLKY